MRRYFISLTIPIVNCKFPLFHIWLLKNAYLCALIYHCITLGSHITAKLIIMFPPTQHDLIFVYWRKNKYGFSNKSLTCILCHEKPGIWGKGWGRKWEEFPLYEVYSFFNFVRNIQIILSCALCGILHLMRMSHCMCKAKRNLLL